MKWPNLDRPPSKYRRFAAGSAGSAADGLRVDRTGGQWGSGLIEGVSIITRGEALGHGQWIDDTFLRQVSEALGAGLFVKSTYGHPDMSGDGIGQYVGRVYGPARGDHGRVRADLHLNPAAHRLGHAEVLFLMAETAPEDFGMSIRFSPDPKAEQTFRVVNSFENPDGALIFKSPDADNRKNLHHARLGTLHAADPVLDPAANPSGLFSAKQTAFLTDAETAMAYVLGFSDQAPEAAILFGMDVQRVRQHAARLSARKGWQLGFSTSEDPMTEDETDDTHNETPSGEALADETPADEIDDEIDDEIETGTEISEAEPEPEGSVKDSAEPPESTDADNPTEPEPETEPSVEPETETEPSVEPDTDPHLAARVDAALSTRVPPGEREAERELCRLLTGEALGRQLGKLEDRPPFHWLQAQAAADVDTVLGRCLLTPAQLKSGLGPALIELKKAELSGGRYSPAPVQVENREVSAFAVIAQAFENQPRLALLDPDSEADRDFDSTGQGLRQKYPGSFRD